MSALRITLLVVLVLTSLFLTLLILLHKGRGGGLSDMFGGGITGSASSSGVAERNLNRITIAMALVWSVSIVLLNVLERFVPSGS
ncbi:MAG: preprotein translocase subunit SecG [Actinomycetales bacterium]